MFYRKKPIVIEAHQLTKNSLMEICRWMNGKCEWSEDFVEDKIELSIPTLRGTLTAQEGDYIIKGIEGEFYACKAEIFEASYEVAE